MFNATKVLEAIIDSNFYKKFAYKHPWLSGSSTYVYPISIWDDRKEIVIQLDGGHYRGRKQSIDAIMKKVNKILPYKYWYIRKSDGSCPSTLNIFFP